MCPSSQSLYGNMLALLITIITITNITTSTSSHPPLTLTHIITNTLTLVELFLKFFFADEIIPLPSATITPSESAISISNQSFELNCMGVGTLRWYRGDDFSMPLDNHTLLLDENATLLLMGNLYEEDFSQTDERGRTYFCTANNSLGVARSRSVQIPCKREGEREREGGGRGQRSKCLVHAKNL